MNHVAYEQWMLYVKNELPEQVRMEYDDHLYSCDDCLELYLQAVDEVETQLPILTNADDFTNSIMAQVAKTKKSNTKVAFYQKTAFHYTIAAAMTFLFMSSGVFQSITKYVDAVQEPTIEERKPSVTEGLVNKTFAFMDNMKNREANNNE
ncbi:hypothetical protein [Robertmurraya kyonggiensis]|uniref:Zinc-finger n=1 Tax=Robertmurraya kyonggiensis TaxID=1037680 RepID=A0A4U1CY03_9BACI|nr:hypothetical protein [Robertmurraya kyonggiensis]TKC14772.1 hypothetical protein FA727_21255 [Robertmurraya kyonggiensis]